MPTIILLVNASVYFHLNCIDMSRHISDRDKSRARGKDSAHVVYVSNIKSYLSPCKSSSRKDCSTLLAMLGQLYWLKLNTECQFILWINRSKEQCSPLLTSAQARFKRCSYTFSHSVPVPLERLQTHQGNIYRVEDRTIFNTPETLKDTRQTGASCLSVQVLWKKEHFKLGSVVHRHDSCCCVLVRSQDWTRLERDTPAFHMFS